MPEREIFNDVKEYFRDKAEGISKDVEHAINGDFGSISRERQRDLANMVKNRMEGASAMEIPINDKVKVEVRENRDRSIVGSIRIDF